MGVNSRERNLSAVWTCSAVLALSLMTMMQSLYGGTELNPEQTAPMNLMQWRNVSVDLPTSVALFPAGPGADIANGQCLICHSAGMVLRQPALTQEQLTAEIEKMRNVFGAPLPADQVEPLAAYLQSVLRSKAATKPPPAAIRQ
jgi:mono/diheme cytochrome c family protein